MTKMTASPMPKADFFSVETPMYGQYPRKREKMKLLTRTTEMMTRKAVAKFIWPSFGLERYARP